MDGVVVGAAASGSSCSEAAEDGVQDTLVEAVRAWAADPPRDPKGWLVTVAWRKFLGAVRADTHGGTARYASRPSPCPARARRWMTRSGCTSCARTPSLRVGSAGVTRGSHPNGAVVSWRWRQRACAGHRVANVAGRCAVRAVADRLGRCRQ
jgi:hypothetical protein